MRKLLSPTAAVLRDGRRQTVAAETLVPGDIVLLQSGDKVPSAMREWFEAGLGEVEVIQAFED